ncbi:MAG: isoaspartyl peptidase/L-asparaginase, partial [Planctomycetota bacterium]|nr:isoaspartyl peptidase/L-asparaginase [Planctomycetota bacterium]
MKKIRQVPLGGAIFVATMLFLLQGLVAGNEDQDSPKWAIVIHGGAGSTPKDSDSPRTRAKRAALKQALDAGVELLEKGGSSLDAVEVVIRILEDNPFFNAGKGAVKNAR